MTNNPATIQTTTLYFNRCPATPRTVLAKKTKDGNYPVTYANLTQAYRKSGELGQLGLKTCVIGNRPYFVQIIQAEAA